MRVILETARKRSDGETRVSVDARPFPETVAETEAMGRILAIAEMKPTNPTTKGAHEGDPVELAREMIAGSTTVLSVLTEPKYLGGSAESLRRIREAIDIPMFRRDFIMNEAQLGVVQSGFVLLIARFVGEDLPTLVEAAHNRNFQPLVEAHMREELMAALAAGVDIVGIGNRDLGKLEVDLDAFEEPTPEVPEDMFLMTEGGVRAIGDAWRMHETDTDALLVGTAITDGDM